MALSVTRSTARGSEVSVGSQKPPFDLREPGAMPLNTGPPQVLKKAQGAMGCFRRVEVPPRPGRCRWRDADDLGASHSTAAAAAKKDSIAALVGVEDRGGQATAQQLRAEAAGLDKVVADPGPVAVIAATSWLAGCVSRPRCARRAGSCSRAARIPVRQGARSVAAR